jgi:hypothetical protein
MTMVKFSEETETPLYFANEEKEIFSVAMSPDKLIYRKHTRRTQTYFTAETIEKFNKTILERTLIAVLI